MQPRDRRPSKRSARSAATTYLEKQLGWLRGYPCGESGDGTVSWTAVPRLAMAKRSESVVVTREHLRRASYGRRRAATRFPRALPAVVGDIAAWGERVELRLSLLKAVIHDGGSLPESSQLPALFRVRRASRERLADLRRSPRLAALLDALLWIHVDDVDALAGALDHVRAHRNWFECVLSRPSANEGLHVAVIALELTADRVPVCEALPVLADPRFWEIPGDGAKPVVARLIAESRHAHHQQVGLIPVPVVDHAPRLCAWIAALPEWPARARATAVELMGRLVDSEHLHIWAAWWRAANEFERTLRRESCKRPKPFWKAFRARLQEELQPPPEPIRVDRWSPHIESVARSDVPEIAALHASILERLPAVDRRQLPCWDQLVIADPRNWSEAHPNRLIDMLRVQLAMLEHVPRHAVRQRAWCGAPLFEDLPRLFIWNPISAAARDRLCAVFSHIGRRAEEWPDDAGEPRNPIPGWGWAVLRGALEAGRSPADVWRLLRVLPTDDDYDLTDNTVMLLLRMTANDVEGFASVVPTWCRYDDDDRPVADFLLGVADPAAWFALITDAITCDEAKRAFDVVRHGRLLTEFSSGESPPIEPLAQAEVRSPPLDGVPGELHEALRRLARVDDDYDAWVSRLRAKVLPDAERWQRELDALTALCADAPPHRRRFLESRRHKLAAWLKTPPRLGATRLDRIRTRIERRRVRLQLDGIQAYIDRALGEALARQMGAAGVNVDWTTRAHQEIAAHVASLSPRFRALGLELLRRATTGDAPVDFRDDPANIRFAEAMDRAGVDLGPWLDDRWQPPAAAGALHLERDPFGVLQMGRPFSTCLAPGAENFFSAVANAVDINKQLVVEWRGGEMRGRCLIALSREGDIVTFHPYTHEAVTEFQARVARFVNALAEAMGTTVVGYGSIEPLVAPDWYDDGPVDLLDPAGQYEWTALLADRPLTADGILETVGDVTGQTPPSPSSLRDLIRWRGVRKHPALLEPVLHALGASPLDPQTRVEIAELALEISAHPLTLQLIEPLLDSDGRRTIRRRFLQQYVIDLLWQAGRPDRALALLRETRPRSVRSWRDEDPARMWSAACCLKALHRPAQALTLFRELASRGGVAAQHQVEALIAAGRGG